MLVRLVKIQTIWRITLYGIPSIDTRRDPNLIEKVIHLRVRGSQFFLGGSWQQRATCNIYDALT